jgi:hypothetical protein
MRMDADDFLNAIVIDIGVEISNRPEATVLRLA